MWVTWTLMLRIECWPVTDHHMRCCLHFPLYLLSCSCRYMEGDCYFTLHACWTHMDATCPLTFAWHVHHMHNHMVYVISCTHAHMAGISALTLCMDARGQLVTLIHYNNASRRKLTNRGPRQFNKLSQSGELIKKLKAELLNTCSPLSTVWDLYCLHSK